MMGDIYFQFEQLLMLCSLSPRVIKATGARTPYKMPCRSIKAVPRSHGEFRCLEAEYLRRFKRCRGPGQLVPDVRQAYLRVRASRSRASYRRRHFSAVASAIGLEAPRRHAEI